MFSKMITTWRVLAGMVPPRANIVKGMNENKLGKIGKRKINEISMRKNAARTSGRRSFLRRRIEMRVVKELVVFLYLNAYEREIETGHYFSLVSFFCISCLDDSRSGPIYHVLPILFRKS